MTPADIADFRDAIGEFVDALAGFRKTVAYQGAVAAMQAENAHRAACGNGPCYADAEFAAVAAQFGFLD
jgi:hypothetical protein